MCNPRTPIASAGLWAAIRMSPPTWLRCLSSPTRRPPPSTSTTDFMKLKPGTWNLRWAVVALAIIMCNDCAAQIQQAWVARYNNGITNGTNQAVKMALDTADNIYVIGISQNSNTNAGYVTIKYAPNGTQLWASRYDSTNHPNAIPAGLVLDNSNCVVVTGSAVTVKYDANGNQLWTAPYAGSAIAIDSVANPIVTGIASSYSTVKLDPTGSNIWQAAYVDSTGPALSQIVLADQNSNIYVLGSE